MSLILAMGMTATTYANEQPPPCNCENPDVPIALYLQDVSIVYTVLGASKFYMNRCGPLSVNGVYYRDLAISLHNLDMNEVQKQSSFQEGWIVAASYSSCELLWDGLDQLGLGFLFAKPE